MAKEDKSEQTKPDVKPTCGIIMPIAKLGNYTAEHWIEVLNIISSVVIEINHIPSLVSESEDVGIIHNRIVGNIAENPIVICDVSGKNPNVMFELGMRLAFDKPTIVIKDELTDYSFDTSPIEHLNYPSSLHYPSIVVFKEKLKAKLEGTIKKAADDPDYSTFLGHFVNYKRELKTEKVSEVDYMMKQMENLIARNSVFMTEREPKSVTIFKKVTLRFKVTPKSNGATLDEIIAELKKTYNITLLKSWLENEEIAAEINVPEAYRDKIINKLLSHFGAGTSIFTT